MSYVGDVQTVYHKVTYIMSYVGDVQTVCHKVTYIMSYVGDVQTVYHKGTYIMSYVGDVQTVCHKATYIMSYVGDVPSKCGWYNKNKYHCLDMQVNCFCVGIFHEISLHKNNESDLQTRIHDKLVLVFMPYYFCFDDINV